MENTASQPDQNPSIEWFFDFISPFAYLQLQTLKEKQQSHDLHIVYRPILFAGLLKHWSHLGPAEIPRKRIMTYQYCHWYAHKHNIPYQTPPAYPLNPLQSLRLAIASGADPKVVDTLFNGIWGRGLDINHPIVWQSIIDANHWQEANGQIGEQWVKDQLRANTEAAIALGAFGVPSLVINNKLFWGHDMTDMALDYLANPGLFDNEEYQRLETLPIAQARKPV